jgi:catechol 2,3-dioxygenase-like lactoylglutathione lyase family enzyme
MAVTQVRVVSVPVSDQERAKAFYVETLGFELLADSPMGPEQRWVQVGPKGGQTSLTLVTWFDTMPPGSLRGVVLECDDLRATRDQLAARGVAFNQEIEEQPWGTFTTFDDPDGNGFVLQQSTPGT